MEILKYSNNADSLKIITSGLPFTFQESCYLFEKSFGKDLVILYSHDDRVCIPLKFYKRFFIITGQLIFPPLRNGMRLNADEEKLFLNKLIHFIKEKNVCHRLIANSAIDVFTGIPNDVMYCPFGQYSIDLLQTPEQIFSKFSGNYRNEIRRAVAGGIELKYGISQLENCFEIYKNTHQRQGISYESFEYFEKLWKYFSPENILCGVSYFNNIPDSCLLIVYTEYAGYYFFGGSAEKTIFPGSSKALQWEVIQFLKSKGIRKYVLGGARLNNIKNTKYEGMQNYKSRFGCTLTRGYLWKVDIVKPVCFAYDLLVNAKNKIFLKPDYKDIIDQEKDKI